MQTLQLKNLVLKALEDLKGKDILALDVAELTSVTDAMIICSGTSNRHVRSLAENVVAEAKKQGVCVIGMEGANQGEWTLVDLGDVVVHVMLPKARDFYSLERLWDFTPLQVAHQ